MTQEEIVGYPRRLVLVQYSTPAKICIINLENKTIEYEEKSEYINEIIISDSNRIYTLSDSGFVEYRYDPEKKEMSHYRIENITNIFETRTNVYYLVDQEQKVYQLKDNLSDRDILTPIFHYDPFRMMQIMHDVEWEMSSIKMVFPNTNMIICNNDGCYGDDSENIEIDQNYQIIQKYPIGWYQYKHIDDNTFIQYQDWNCEEHHYIDNKHHDIVITYFYRDGSPKRAYKIRDFCDKKDQGYYYLSPPIILQNKNICFLFESLIIVLNDRQIVFKKEIPSIHSHNRGFFKMFPPENSFVSLGSFICSSNTSSKIQIIDIKNSSEQIFNLEQNYSRAISILQEYSFDRKNLWKRVSPLLPSFLPKDLVNLIGIYL